MSKPSPWAMLDDLEAARLRLDSEAAAPKRQRKPRAAPAPHVIEARERRARERAELEDMNRRLDAEIAARIAAEVRRRLAGTKGEAALRHLGITTTATIEDVKRAFRRRALTEHPDKGGNVDAFRRTVEAYELALASLGDAR